MAEAITKNHWKHGQHFQCSSAAQSFLCTDHVIINEYLIIINVLFVKSWIWNSFWPFKTGTFLAASLLNVIESC